MIKRGELYMRIVWYYILGTKEKSWENESEMYCPKKIKEFEVAVRRKQRVQKRKREELEKVSTRLKNKQKILIFFGRMLQSKEIY